MTREIHTALHVEHAGPVEEITVTATKRGEISIMDLAGSIQAFDTEAIRNQGLTDMESYTKLMELRKDPNNDPSIFLNAGDYYQVGQK